MVNWLNKQYIPNGIIAIIDNKSQLQECKTIHFSREEI